MVDAAHVFFYLNRYRESVRCTYNNNYNNCLQILLYDKFGLLLLDARAIRGRWSWCGGTRKGASVRRRRRLRFLATARASVVYGGRSVWCAGAPWPAAVVVAAAAVAVGSPGVRGRARTRTTTGRTDGRTSAD